MAAWEVRYQRRNCHSTSEASSSIGLVRGCTSAFSSMALTAFAPGSVCSESLRPSPPSCDVARVGVLA